MANLLNWLKHEANVVYHGINPLDRGQGWTSAPPPRRAIPPPPMYRGGPVNIGGLRVNNAPAPAPASRPIQPDPIAKYFNTAFIQPVLRSPAAKGIRIASAELTGNNKAKQNAVQDLKQQLAAPSREPLSVIKNGRRQINPKGLARSQQATNLAVIGAIAPGGVKAKTGPSLLDKEVRPIKDVLNKINPGFGDLLAKRRDTAETLAAKAKSRLKVTEQLKPEEQINLARVLKGTEKPVNDQVAAAAKEVRPVLNTAYYHAKNSGVKVAGYRKNYFPQIYNPKVFKEGTSENLAAAQHLISTGQASNDVEAQRIISGLLDKRRKVGPYGNLAKSRQSDLPGYAENNAAIHHYLDKVYKQVSHAKTFGKNEKKLDKILKDIRENNPEHYDTAVKFYNRASGLDRGKGDNVANVLTGVQGGTKLGLSPLGNIQQQQNNAVSGGIWRTVKQGARYPLSKSSKELSKQSGVTSEQVAHEALFGEQGVADKLLRIPGTQKTIKLRSVTAPGFEGTEKANRAIGGTVGVDEASALAKRASKGSQRAASALERRYGITRWKKDGTLYKNDEIVAARKFVERTQFRTHPLDLPYRASSPSGRVITQFKRYPYKQAGFIKREIADEARHGNLAPLARLLALAPVGIGANQLTDKARNYVGTKAGVPEQVLNTVSDVTGANLVANLAQQLYPNSVDANAYAAKVTKAIGGPTIGDAVKLVQAGFDAGHKKYDTAGRFALSHLSAPGAFLQSRVFPYGGSSAQGKSTSPKNIDPNSEQAKADSKVQKADFIKNAPKQGYGLNKLPNGKYIYSLNGKVHTTSDLAEARKYIAEDAFKNSGDKYRIIPNIAPGGGLVLRRSDSGSITSTSKLKFNYDFNNSTLTLLKKQEDYAGWVTTAKDQLNNIDKQLKLKTTDPLDAVRLKSKRATILKDLAKYADYGGKFKKGSSGYGRSGGRAGSRGGRGSFSSTGFKTATSTNFPKPPKGVKVRKPTTSSKLTVKKITPPKKTKIGYNKG